MKKQTFALIIVLLSASVMPAMQAKDPPERRAADSEKIYQRSSLPELQWLSMPFTGIDTQNAAPENHTPLASPNDRNVEEEKRGFLHSPKYSAWENIATEPESGRMDNVLAIYDNRIWSVTGYGNTASVRYYQPADDTWTIVPNSDFPHGINYARSGAIYGSKVYIYGDAVTAGFTGLWSYDMNANIWAQENPTGTPPPHQGIWAPAWVADPETGYLYLTGGATTSGGGNLTSVYVYDPVNNAWLAPLPGFTSQRDFHAAFIYHDPATGNKMLAVAGGVNASSVALSSTQAFNFSTGTWNAENTDIPAMPFAWWGMGYAHNTMGVNDHLWLIGGSDTNFDLIPGSHYFDVNGQTWTDGGVYHATPVFRNSAIALNGEVYKISGSPGGFSPTGNSSKYPLNIYPLPFEEGFSGLPDGSIPASWTRTHGNWGATNSNYAGGEVPEMTFYYWPSSTDVFMLITPLLDAAGLEQVYLSFKQAIDNYSGDYTLKIQTSTDGVTWTDQWEQYIPAGGIKNLRASPAMGNVRETESITAAASTLWSGQRDTRQKEEILIELQEVAGESFYLAFVFDGDSYNINNWYIDDVFVGYIPLPEVSIQPENFAVMLEPGGSAMQDLTIQNTGNEGSILEVFLMTIPGVEKADNTHYRKPGRKTDGLSVLYATALVGSDTDFIAGLQALPGIENFEVFDSHAQTPYLEYMLDFDVILVASNFGFENPELMGDRLALYVDFGGRVCLLQSTMAQGGAWALGGEIMQPEYSPLMVAPYNIGHTEITQFETHPINTGLSLISTNLYSYTETQGAGISLGNFDIGNPFAAYNPEKPVVAINVIPYNDFWGGDLILLAENTINWLMEGYSGVDWLSLEMTEISIPDGESQAISVGFDAGELTHGVYQARIMILSNDRENPLIQLPVTLTVAPSYSLTLLVNPEEAGIVEGGGNYFEGEVVNISATAHEGFLFINWTDHEDNHISADPIFQHTMPAGDLVLTANFAQDFSGIASPLAQEVLIYPNPASAMLYVEFENSGKTGVTLYDLQGRSLEKVNIDKTGKVQISFNVEHLQAGVYFLSIRGEKESRMHKVVIRP